KARSSARKRSSSSVKAKSMLGGRPSNHGGCGERSGGARRQPRCQMVARSSLLRRPTPGARPARRTSSVVAALAALAPRLVRLAHHGHSGRLLAVLVLALAAPLAADEARPPALRDVGVEQHLGAALPLDLAFR